tara:strand:- start:151 stop:318 length:168 start_codon:yes stop_codon:yes gene_type:complete
MRNIFDQYTQPENKLTHSLISCLNEEIDLSKIDDSIDKVFANLDQILKNLSFKIE